MLGLLKITPDTVNSISSFDIYQSHYCGLCHALSREYGQLARLVTNYETTLLFLFFHAFQAEEVREACVRCPVKIIKKNAFTGDAAIVAADMSVVLFYEKMLDDEADENTRLPDFLRRKVQFGYEKANQRLMEQGCNVKRLHDLMIRQRKFEASNVSALDTISRPTSLMLATIFDFLARLIPQPSQTHVFREIGYHLGRWIYIMDSIIDFEKDAILKRYNPLVLRCSTNDRKVKLNNLPDPLVEEVKKSLEITLHALRDAADQLRANRFHELVSDILTTTISRKTVIALEAIDNNTAKSNKMLQMLQTTTAIGGTLLPQLAFAVSGNSGSDSVGDGGSGGFASSCGIKIVALGIMGLAPYIGCNVLCTGSYCGSSKKDGRNDSC